MCNERKVSDICMKNRGSTLASALSWCVVSPVQKKLRMKSMRYGQGSEIRRSSEVVELRRLLILLRHIFRTRESVAYSQLYYIYLLYV
jgi:hypothetical protein